MLIRTKEPQSYKEYLHKASNIQKKYPTVSETIFRDKLDKLKIKYKWQWCYTDEYIGGIVDFYLEGRKLAIEVDGGYHNTSYQRGRDKTKDFVLKQKKIKVIRLTNEQAEAIELEALKELVGMKTNKYRRKEIIRNIIKQEISGY